MTPTEGAREQSFMMAIAALFALVAVLAIIDVLSDLREGTTAGHVAIEGAVVVVGFIGAGWMSLRVRTLAHEAQELRVQARELAANLDASRVEAEGWRAEARDLIVGLSAAIDRQLERWTLTPAEKEIALLLLKGLSHKEIAAIREVGETTVRQQARAIYRKAGLGGRNDLAAFFLEDLLVPRSDVALRLDATGKTLPP
jgi:DNA-binding CsgD family transcriptional regulator